MDIKTIIDNVKAIKEIADATQNQDLRSLILELKEQMLELREENLVMKEELSKRINYNMYFEDNLYWDLKDDKTKEGPYCSACWDNAKKAIRLKEGIGVFACPVCKNIVSNYIKGGKIRR